VAGPHVALTAGACLGPYEIRQAIGAGGMGEVYRAWDRRLEREVAMKVLPASLREDPVALLRLQREARAIASLSHPNVLAIHDIGEHDGALYVITELLEGMSLRVWLQRRPLKVEETFHYARQIAAGLGAAHAKEIIHRDIKPENLFVTRDGAMKILDFGLARQEKPPGPGDATESLRTSPGTVMGTIGYMSPEQIRGIETDERTDIFSFGCVLYEMLAGSRPFQRATGAETLTAILREEPEPLGENAPVALGAIVTRCLSKEPEDRFRNAGELVLVLEQLSLGLVSSSRSVPKRKTASPRAVTVRRRPGRIRSLAVLPLQNLSRDPDQEYLAEAITELLLTDLAQIKALKVISRTSVMRYREVRKPLPEIALELNVDAIVEGSVLREGDSVRITAQLIHGRTDHHLWARSYQREVSDLLGLQSEVAQAIADEIQIELTRQERSRLAKVHPVVREAHEAYLKGIYHFDRLELALGMDYFQRSIEVDPTYAPAHGRIARGYYYLGLFGMLSPAEAFASVKASCAKALEYDESLAEAHGYRALARVYYDWDWVGAGEEFRRALELKPSHAEISHGYAHYLMVLGRAEEGLAACERAVALDPLGAILTACLGWHCLFSRQIDEAIEPSLKALRIAPDLFWAHTVLGWAYEHKCMYEEAIATYQTAVALSGAMVLNVAALGHVLVVAGREQEAREVLGQLMERSKQSYVSAYDIALLHVGLDDREQALEWLERAYAERSSFLLHISWDPRFDRLRLDPRFPAFLRRIGLPEGVGIQAAKDVVLSGVSP
jgi:eukaryotic-like serine/threonine-protein kinase